MAYEKALTLAFERALHGDVGSLRDMTHVDWCLGDVALFGQDVRVEAAVRAGGPGSHTLVITGGWGLLPSVDRHQEILRLPGNPSAGGRPSVWTLPIDLSHRCWHSPTPGGTWFEPQPGQPVEVEKDVVARLRLRWDSPSEPNHGVTLDYEMRRTIRFVTEWPEDYPLAVASPHAASAIRVTATTAESDDHLFVHIDRIRPTGIPFVWRASVTSATGEHLLSKDVVLSATADGISLTVPVRMPQKFVRVHLVPSREVARRITCAGKYVDFEFDAAVPVGRL